MAMRLRKSPAQVSFGKIPPTALYAIQYMAVVLCIVAASVTVDGTRTALGL